uniref:Uncharacterized protein n=1 Tax=Acrobeloides nanus TaxID=290746 RepID=A0A914DQU8_9BILA
MKEKSSTKSVLKIPKSEILEEEEAGTSSSHVETILNHIKQEINEETSEFEFLYPPPEICSPLNDCEAYSSSISQSFDPVPSTSNFEGTQKFSEKIKSFGDDFIKLEPSEGNNFSINVKEESIDEMDDDQADSSALYNFGEEMYFIDKDPMQVLEQEKFLHLLDKKEKDRIRCRIYRAKKKLKSMGIDPVIQKVTMQTDNIQNSSGFWARRLQGQNSKQVNIKLAEIQNLAVQFPGIQESTFGSNYFYCNICTRHFEIVNGDTLIRVKKHILTNTHINKASKNSIPATIHPFKESYKKFAGIKESEKGECYFYCQYCAADFPILEDQFVHRHIGSKAHLERVQFYKKRLAELEQQRNKNDTQEEKVQT